MQILFALSLLCFGAVANAQIFTAGTYEVETKEYKFEATTDPEVMADRKTELWAKVFWPKNIKELDKKLPLISFLHGNHSTCGTGKNPRRDSGSGYTTSGVCPEGYVVVPNHEGYDYVAQKLASHGYIVFSINANRGITAGSGVSGDSGLNLARGRLVLKHLATWYQWSTVGGAPEALTADPNLFVGKINFAHVGLMGHSRGGEGMRAAYTQYLDENSIWTAKIPKMKVEAIFEIGAVDGQTSRKLDAEGAVWNQLIPVCDGDVSNLQGINPYNRMVRTAGAIGSAQKSVMMVYGANHNYFNTEWQSSDSSGCYKHDQLWEKGAWFSEKQTKIGDITMLNFFLANVGEVKQKELNTIFNPMNSVISALSEITTIERDFSPNPNLKTQIRFDDFLKADEPEMIREPSANVTLTYGSTFSSTLFYTLAKWTEGGDSTLKLTSRANFDVTNAKSLDLRLSLSKQEVLVAPLDFDLVLIDAKGTESNPVKLTQFLNKTLNPFYSMLFQTIRIPLNLFSGIELNEVAGMKFKFLSPVAGAMALANIRFSNLDLSLVEEVAPVVVEEPVVPVAPEQAMKLLAGMAKPMTKVIAPAKNKLVDVKADRAGTVLMTFTSEEAFTIGDALPMIKIGNKTFDISHIDDVNGVAQITFHIPATNYNALKGLLTPVKIFYRERPNQIWDFGKLSL